MLFISLPVNITFCYTSLNRLKQLCNKLPQNLMTTLSKAVLVMRGRGVQARAAFLTTSYPPHHHTPGAPHITSTTYHQWAQSQSLPSSRTGSLTPPLYGLPEEPAMFTVTLTCLGKTNGACTPAWTSRGTITVHPDSCRLSRLWVEEGPSATWVPSSVLNALERGPRSLLSCGRCVTACWRLSPCQLLSFHTRSPALLCICLRHCWKLLLN